MRRRQDQREMAEQMLAFLKECPDGPEITECRNFGFLYHFEAARQLIVQEHLHRFGFGNNEEIDILDFGFLSGITQEFMHRAFPKAKFRVFDRPDGTLLSNEPYLRVIRKRKYLSLEPGDLTQLTEVSGKYDVIHLGEIIEHLDPTAVVKALKMLRACAKPKCCLIITTPNKRGIYNCWMTLRGKDSIEVAPIPNPVHGYGHIHLWGADILAETAAACGWNGLSTSFYHGREGEKFDKKMPWKLRVVMFLAKRYPKMKGFFVSSFSAV